MSKIYVPVYGTTIYTKRNNNTIVTIIMFVMDKIKFKLDVLDHFGVLISITFYSNGFFFIFYDLTIIIFIHTVHIPIL